MGSKNDSFVNVDDKFTVQLSDKEIEDLNDLLVLAGALVKKMNLINQRVQDNFAKMWNICCNAYLKDRNNGNK